MLQEVLKLCQGAESTWIHSTQEFRQMSTYVRKRCHQDGRKHVYSICRSHTHTGKLTSVQCNRMYQCIYLLVTYWHQHLASANSARVTLYFNLCFDGLKRIVTGAAEAAEMLSGMLAIVFSTQSQNKGEWMDGWIGCDTPAAAAVDRKLPTAPR